MIPTRFKNCEKYEFMCPICCKPDWCGYTYYADTETTYVYCHRYQLIDENDVNGKMVSTKYGVFVGIGVTNDGFAKFRDYASWNENQKRKKGKKKEKKSDVAKVVKPVKILPTPKPTLEVSIREDDYLDRVYRKMLDLLILEDCNIRELREHDGWNQNLMDKVLKRYPLRSLPPTDWERFSKEGPRYAEFQKLKNMTRKKLIMKLQEEFGPDGLSGVPGFYQTQNGAWTLSTEMDGYLIPQYSHDGKLYRLRIRTSQRARDNAAWDRFEKMTPEKRKEIADNIKVNVDNTEAIVRKISKGYGKYIAMSSPNRKGGCSSGSQLSFYGLEYLKDYPNRKIKRAIVIEGEKKGIVASIERECLVITLPGVGTYRLIQPVIGWLKSLDIDRIAVANDTDMMQNAVVRDATVGLLHLVQENEMIPEMVLWNEAFGKGYDDCIVHGGKEQYRRVTGL